VTELMTFGATFGLVFALALQSLNTNRGHYRAAVITSFVIGTFQLYVLKILPVSASWTFDLAYLAGGPFGAIAAMYLHPRLIGRRRK
jgi:hypothetical protein